MTLVFYTQDNENVEDYWSLGYLSVRFTNPLAYMVKKCTDYYEEFQVTPPTETNKIWTIRKSFTDLTIDCNEIRVVDIDFATSSTSECEDKWSQDVSKMTFWNNLQHTDHDTASDGYRLIPDPINGGWSNFEGWTQCSAVCGGGTQTRTRTCTKPSPKYGGAYCEGDSTETRECNAHDCPGKSRTDLQNHTRISNH